MGITLQLGVREVSDPSEKDKAEAGLSALLRTLWSFSPQKWPCLEEGSKKEIWEVSQGAEWPNVEAAMSSWEHPFAVGVRRHHLQQGIPSQPGTQKSLQEAGPTPLTQPTIVLCRSVPVCGFTTIWADNLLTMNLEVLPAVYPSRSWFSVETRDYSNSYSTLPSSSTISKRFSLENSCSLEDDLVHPQVFCG